MRLDEQFARAAHGDGFKRDQVDCQAIGHADRDPVRLRTGWAPGSEDTDKRSAVFCGFRPATAADLERLGHWLAFGSICMPMHRASVAPVRHWSSARHRLLNRRRPSTSAGASAAAVHRFETHHQEGIFARLSDASKAAIDELLVTDEPESPTKKLRSKESVSFSDLKSDPGKPGVESLLTSIATLQCIDGLGLSVSVFEPVAGEIHRAFRSVVQRSRSANYGATQPRFATAL